MIEIPLWLPQLMVPMGGLLFMLEFLVGGNADTAAQQGDRCQDRK